MLGEQSIVKYWDFPSKTSRNSHKGLVPKIFRQDQREIFVKLSLRDRLVGFADFAGKTPLVCLPNTSCCGLLSTFRFLLPLLNCFLRVCVPTNFAAVSKLLLPLTTSAVSGHANSNKLAPTHLRQLLSSN